jgi:hypothetical protein
MENTMSQAYFTDSNSPNVALTLGTTADENNDIGNVRHDHE